MIQEKKLCKYKINNSLITKKIIKIKILYKNCIKSQVYNHKFVKSIELKKHYIPLKGELFEKSKYTENCNIYE